MSGQRVTFREGVTKRQGYAIEVFTAGFASGTGIKRRRERVRIRFEEGQQWWQTCRDLDAVIFEAQLELF